jgi:hypothetical protein
MKHTTVAFTNCNASSVLSDRHCVQRWGPEDHACVESKRKLSRDIDPKQRFNSCSRTLYSRLPSFRSNNFSSVITSMTRWQIQTFRFNILSPSLGLKSKTEAICSTEMSVTTCMMTWCSNSEDHGSRFRVTCNLHGVSETRGATLGACSVHKITKKFWNSGILDASFSYYGPQVLLTLTRWTFMVPVNSVVKLMMYRSCNTGYKMDAS